MPDVEVNGVSIHYRERGRGEPVVFLHEYFGTQRGWQSQVDALGRYYRAVAVDFRGHGRSSWSGDRLRITDLVEDIAGLLRRLELGPARLVGASLGGLTALLLGQRHPELARALIVVGPPQLSEPGTLAWAARFVHEIYPADPARWQEGHEAQPHGHVESVLLRSFDLDRIDPPGEMIAAVEQAGQIACPALIVGGDNDPVFPPHRAVALASRMPSAELCILPRGGHLPHRDLPAVFTAVLLDFLRRHGA